MKRCVYLFTLMAVVVFCKEKQVDHSQHTAAREDESIQVKPSADGQGIVHLEAGRAQGIGITTDIVGVREFIKTVRTSGIVKVNEPRQNHVHVKFAGYVEQVYADFAGKSVQAGSPLFSIYSPEVYSTQTEYLLALKRTEEEPPGSTLDDASTLASVEKRFALWDIPQAEIDQLRKTRTARRSVIIRSPITGTILEKKILSGMTVEPGMDLYLIADLSRIWVQAEVYESEISSITLGQKAKLTLESASDQVYEGRVTFIDPVVNEKTRTTGVRYEFANPGLRLRPGMFVTVDLLTSHGKGVGVPVDAVIDTGTRKIVFVQEGSHEFRAREIKIGIQSDRYYSVLSGLVAGDKIVTSGQFLLDSESRLKAPGNSGEHKH
ncbi:MAG: efflux RND transporter periplasmic adaptor subunit [Leptospirales bacterium]|nr:efflux RND transporter periplasmic adaptor subunit [Leptospirales bacterium]